MMSDAACNIFSACPRKMDEVQCWKAAQMRSETKEVVACCSISESIKWKN
jgi:hypothetical protein